MILRLVLIWASSAACATAPRVVQDSPAANADVPGARARLTWHVENAADESFIGYQVQVSADPTFEKVHVDQQATGSPVELSLDPGRYFWRVRGAYETMGGRTRQTPWSDEHIVNGQFINQPTNFSVLGSPKTPPPPKTTKSPKKVARVSPKKSPKRRSSGRPKVVGSHANKPALDGLQSLSVAVVNSDENRNKGLTREVLVRLFGSRSLVLLEGDLVSLPADIKERRFVIDEAQATEMLAPGAVRLSRPDAIMKIRIYGLDIDPGSLPQPPSNAKDRAGFFRFDEGVRALNASLVSTTTGQILWTVSLYANAGVSDLTLVDELVKRYFR